MKIKNLNPRELKGFLKVADILVCGNEEFPRFSQTNFVEKIDYILEELPKDDLLGLKILFYIFSFLPVFMIRSIVEWTENPWGPSILKDNLLKINSGLKGIIFTIYYSRLPGEGERIFSQLGWNTVIPGYAGENRFHELS